MRNLETLITGRLRGEPPRFGASRLALALLMVLTVIALGGCSRESGGEQSGGGQSSGQSSGSAGTATANTSGEDWPVTDVAAEVEPSVVQVNVEQIQQGPAGVQQGQGVGSGVIYREDGYIITNAHVVEGADEVNVAFADGTTEQGRVVGADEFTDLAVVKVDRQGLPAANFADSNNLAPGQLAVAIGSPSGFESTVTSGVISGLGREVPSRLTGGAQPALVDLIQTDAAISPGSSGGALADADGDIVGINAAYLPPAQTGAVNIGFAIPANTATSVADQLIEDGEAVHPYLGISLTNLTPEIAQRFGIEAEQGALVTGVDPDGPSAEAGIQNGTVITAVGGTQVESAAEVISALRDFQPGESIQLTVTDGSGSREITVDLGERDQ